jgi:hypothetical protein
MANLKISQLTATTTNTIGSWVVINNSGETTSNKSQLEYVLGLTTGAGANSIRSNDFLSTSATTSAGDSSIAIGNGAVSSDNSSISLGKGAESLEAQGIAIGENASAGHISDIAIGYNALTDTDGGDSGDAIAIGTNSRARRDYGIAIGYDAQCLDDGIAIGRSTRPIGNSCIAIGASNVAAGNNGYAIGYSIFSDKTDAGAIGATMYVDGERSVAIGANGSIGQSGGDCPDSVNIGSTNIIAGGGSKQISIGYEANTSAPSAINISNGGLSVSSAFGLNIGGSGNTYGGGSQKFGEGNIRIGGFDNEITFTPGSRNVWVGGIDNSINSGGGGGKNNIYLGLSGRTYSTIGDNYTYVENLAIYGSVSQSFDTFTGSTIVIDLERKGFVEVSAVDTGTTYNISVSPAPDNIGKTLTLFIEYVSGATVNFDGSGSVQWRWNPLYGTPVFSGTSGQTTRSIIVVNTWDGNDMWEVSRSMNMV